MEGRKARKEMGLAKKNSPEIKADMIIYTNKLPSGVAGMALYPFILLRSRDASQKLITHERIHIRQQAEVLALFAPVILWLALFHSAWFWLAMPAQPFYLVYVAEYLFRLAKHRNRNAAYRAISFEKEAYLNEKNAEYPDTRPFMNWINYL